MALYRALGQGGVGPPLPVILAAIPVATTAVSAVLDVITRRQAPTTTPAELLNQI